MTEDVIAAARRYFEALNRHDIAEITATLAPGYLHHSGAGDLDAATFLSTAAKYVESFPDFRYDVAEVLSLANGQSAVVRWVMRGTQLGAAFGAPPSGKAFASPGFSLLRFDGGRLVEDWEYGDDIAMFEDLGFQLVPPAS